MHAPAREPGCSSVTRTMLHQGRPPIGPRRLPVAGLTLYPAYSGSASDRSICVHRCSCSG
eukprot:365721-Chlamydomonas_euryale.AAC.6